MDDNSHIIEGEEAEEETPEITPQDVKQNDAVVLLNLESLIKGNLSQMEKLQREAREVKETLENILNNDPTYKQHSEEAKKANQVKSATRVEISKRSDVKQVVEKLKSFKQDLKDIQDSMPEYLAEYQRLSNSNVIMNDDGEELEIISVAKIVKTASRR